MNVCDPRDVAEDGRTKTVFMFSFTTIEDALVLDNNYPCSAGREFGCRTATSSS